MIFSKKTKYFIFGLFIFFTNNSYAAQIDLSSGQTWGVTREAIQDNFDEVYTAIDNTYIAALIGGNISGSLITSGTVDDSYIDTNIPRLDGTHSITGTYSFPETAYSVSTWDALSTPVTKNSFRDYLYNFDADGDGSFTDELWFPNLLGKEDADSDITKANENETITGLWAFPDASYDVSTWDAVNTPVTKNSFRDYLFNFDADGDGSFTDESWFPTVNTFDPEAPGEIGGTTPAAGTFTTVTATEFNSSAADGERGIILPENTTKSPGTGLEEIYNEGGLLKYSENGVEKNFITIDDTAGDGDTTVTLSADKIAEYIAGVSVAAGLVEAPPTYRDSTGTKGQYAYSANGLTRYDCIAANTWFTSTLTDSLSNTPTTPTLTSLTIPEAGTTAIAVFSEAMTTGAGGAGGWTLDTPTNAMTYSSGTGTDTLTFSLASTILDSDTPTVSYTQPTNGWESNDDQTDLASIVTASVTNNSTQTAGVACSGDFSSGSNESFESSEDAFCTTDGTVADTTGVISTYDTNFYNTGTHGMSIVCDSDNSAANNRVYFNYGSAVNSVYYRAYISMPTLENYAGLSPINVNQANVSDVNTILFVSYANNSGEYRIKIRTNGVNTAEYFVVTPGVKYRVEIHAVKAGACAMRLYDASGTQLETSNGGGDTECEVTGGNKDFQYIVYPDSSTSATAATFYVDDAKISTSGWVGAE